MAYNLFLSIFYFNKYLCKSVDENDKENWYILKAL